MSSYLLIVDRAYPNPSSNGNCAIKIAEELVQRNNSVIMLSLFDCNMKAVTINDVDYFFAGFDETQYFVSLYHKLFSCFEDNHAVNRLNSIANSIISSHCIDVIIGFYKPIDILICGQNLSKKFDLRFIPVLYDIPVTKYENHLKRRFVNYRFKKQIKKLQNKGQIYILKYNADYFRRELKIHDSLALISVPNIKEIECDSIKVTRKTIKLVYTGSFWPTIRNPQLMLDSLSFLADYNVEIHLYSWGCDEILKKFKDVYKGKLILHGRCDSNTINQAYSDASVLLNLSNNTDYQVPGKIFEYFSTGKPILNFIFSNNDPAIEEYNKYPNICTIKLGTQINKTKIIDFIFNQSTKIIDYCDIEKIYYQSTAKYFVDLI